MTEQEKIIVDFNKVMIYVRTMRDLIENDFVIKRKPASIETENLQDAAAQTGENEPKEEFTHATKDSPFSLAMALFEILRRLPDLTTITNDDLFWEIRSLLKTNSVDGIDFSKIPDLDEYSSIAEIIKKNGRKSELLNVLASVTRGEEEAKKTVSAYIRRHLQ